MDVNMLFPRYILNVVVLIIVVFGFGQNLKAQNSKYLDAVWYYDQFDDFGINRSFSLRVVDTAVFNGKTYLKLEYDQHHCAVISSRYIRYSSDGKQIYYFDDSKGVEFKLYNFELQVGDEFELFYHQDQVLEKAIFRLDSVVNKTQFSTSYEMQYFTQTQGHPLDGYREVIKGLGSRWFLFPSNGACDAYDPAFIRCFEANGELKRFVDYDCQETIVEIKDISNPDRIGMETSSSYISFNGGDQTLYVVEVYDMLGKLVLQIPSAPLAQQKIALEKLSSGMNVISVSSGSGASKLFKVWR